MKTSVYSSVDDLPLYNFIKITLGGDLTQYGVDQLTWANILNQYAEQCQDKSISRVFQLTVQITYLSNKLNIIFSIINQLSLRRNDELIEILHNQGFNFKFDDLVKDLERVISRCKSDKIKLQQYLDQRAELQKPGEEQTEQSWNDELTELGKYQGYAINKKETTVGEYLSIKRSYKQHVEHLKNNQGTR